MPCNIGRGTARVLKGCLERDVRNRLTIAMVDEIAWDIGLEEADEASSVSHADESEFVDFHDQPTTSTRGRSRSRSRNHTVLDRPTSHPRRSVSHASATTSSSLSTRSTSRSVSRPPTTCLPLTTACDDIEHAPVPLDIGGSALMSLTSPVERGRSPRKADSRLNNRFAPSIGASTARSDLGREPSCGREIYSGTDVLDNTARWASALGLNTIAEVTTHLNGASSTAVERLRKIQQTHRFGESRGSKRAESTPPVSSAWPLRQSRVGPKGDPSSLGLGQSVCAGGFLRQPSAAPIPIVRKNATRSRSVGFEPNSTARQLF